LSLDPKQNLLRALEFGAIKRLLLSFDFAEEIFLDAVRQVFGDLAFRAAQQERANARGEPAAGEGVTFGVVEACKLSAAAENPWHSEGHKAPEIEQAIFNWRAGKHQPMFGAQSASDLRGLGAWIFDVLALIEDDCLPTNG